jgi:transcriptional regulator with XRE-family HTH domain
MSLRSDKSGRASKPTRVNRVVLDRYKKRVPARLAQIRGERSQRSFARDLGVFQQNVNRYENGTTPHADFLIALAIQENVSLDWLLLGRGRPRRR